MIKHADLLLLSHPSILKGLRLCLPAEKCGPRICGVISPEFNPDDANNRIMHNTEHLIEITGNVTQHRQTLLDKINRDILIFGMNSDLKGGRARGFQQINPHEKRGTFSFHPPQSRHWAYSSPTRIYRAIAIDYSIPIISHYFGQHPIEDLCLIYSGPETLELMSKLIKDREACVNYLYPRMLAYNEKIKILNNQVIEAIVTGK